MKLFSIFRSGGLMALLVFVGLICTFLAYGVTTEIPTGGVIGTVTMKENGKVLPNVGVILRPVVKDPEQEAQSKVHFMRTDATGKFAFRNVPAGVYSVEVSATAHTLDEKKIVVNEGKTQTLNLALDPIEPYLTIYTSQKVFTPKEDPNIQIHGFVKEKSLKVKLYSVPIDTILKTRNWYELFRPYNNVNSFAELEKNLPNAKAVQEFDWKIEPNDAEGTFKKTLATPKLAPGIYWMRLEAGKAQRSTFLMVSEIGMVAKVAKGKLDAFVSNIVTGEPIPGAKLTYSFGESATEIATSDSTGQAKADVKIPGVEQSIDSAVIAEYKGSHAIITFSDYGQRPDGAKILIYTDRPVYRPGDEVQFKAIVREPNGYHYKLPAATNAQVRVLDYTDRVLEEFTAPINQFGTLNGKFNLPKYSTQSVTIEVTVGDAAERQWVNIQSYRKPEFKITVEPKKGYFIRGDLAQFTVKCEYYFGGPVVGAKIDATFFKSPLWSWVDPDTGEEESSGGYGEDYLGDQSTVTDQNGETTVTFNTADIKFSQWDDIDQELSVQISGSEGDDRYFDGQGSVKLVRGDYNLVIDQENYVVRPGEDANFEVTLSSNDPKSTESLAGKQIEVESGFEIWNGKDSSFHPESKQVVTVDKDGKAKFTFKPGGTGDYRVKARISDSRGNLIQSSAWVWCWAQGQSWESPSSNLTLLLDKKTYKPGDDAKVLVRSGQKSGSVWVTVETDRVKLTKVVKLSEGIGEFTFPVTDDLKPNAFVTVSSIYEKKFTDARRKLKIDRSDESINIAIKPSKQKLQPGETVKYDLTTTDINGNPVSADLSLSIVDEAIYAIASDSLNLMDEFYPERYSQVGTYNSFPEVYLDGGDKADSKMSGEARIRTDFRDTAGWFASIQTDSSGKATVDLKLPDNLTSWRATAVGLTSDTKVGKSASNVTVAKDLMVRFSAPQYFTQGDKAIVTANVNSSTDSAQEVEVKLQAEGCSVIGETTKKVTVSPNGSQQVQFEIECKQFGSASFLVQAKSAQHQDGLRISVPIKVHGRVKPMALVGKATSDTSLEISRGDLAEGNFSIRISPSYRSLLDASITRLMEYPFGCAEQTLNKFLGPAEYMQTMQTLGTPLSSEMRENIAQSTEKGLQRLYTMQSSYGGWAWYQNGEPDKHITAIVLEGLGRMRQLGFAVDGVILDNGRAWAVRTLSTKPAKHEYMIDRYMLAAAVLTLGPDATAEANLPARWKPEHPTYLVAAALRGYVAIGNTAKATAASEELWRRAQVRETVIRWPSTWGSYDSASTILALLQYGVSAEQFEKMMQGLSETQYGGMWSSTLDSGLAVRAMCASLAKFPEQPITEPVEVLVNGKSRGTLKPGDSVFTYTNEMDELNPGKNTVELKVASGVVRYAVTWSDTKFENKLEAIPAQGITVNRTFHALTTERSNDGSLSLVPTKSPSTLFTPGQPVRCIVKVNSKKALSYAMVLIPLPAGLKSAERLDIEDWTYWFDMVDVFDDRIAIYVRDIPKGETTFDFNLRAETQGSTKCLPAQVFEMYSPEMSASSSGATIEVRK